MAELRIDDSNISELSNLKDDKYKDVTEVTIKDVMQYPDIVIDTNTVQLLRITNCRIKSIIFSNCPSLQRLYCLSSIVNSNLDLTPCSNIENVYTYHTSGITKLNLYNCQQLKSITCNFDNFEELNVVGCFNLKNIQSGLLSPLKHLDLTRCCSLEYLSTTCHSINLQDCGNLKIIHGYIGNNVDLSFLPYLKTYSYPHESKVVNIDLPKSIEQIAIGSGYLKTVNLKNCSKLFRIMLCNSPNLSHLDLSDCTSLTHLIFKNTNLKTLVLPETYPDTLKYFEYNGGRPVSRETKSSSFEFEYPIKKVCPQLTTLIYNNVAIPNPDLSLYPNLVSITIENCAITTLDFSCCPKLEEIYLENNINLTSIDLSSCRCLKNLRLDISNLTNLVLPENYSETLEDFSYLVNNSIFKNTQVFESAIEYPIREVCPKLTNLICHCIKDTNFDLSLYPSLTNIRIIKSSMTKLDFSHCPDITEIYLNSNENLTDVIITNYNKDSQFNSFHNKNLKNITLLSDFNLNRIYSDDENINQKLTIRD